MQPKADLIVWHCKLLDALPQEPWKLPVELITGGGRLTCSASGWTLPKRRRGFQNPPLVDLKASRLSCVLCSRLYRPWHRITRASRRSYSATNTTP